MKCGCSSKHLTNDSVELISKYTENSPALLSIKLTKIEVNCLVLAASGKTSDQTATLLGIKPSTVESHRREIKRKLNSSSMAQAVFEGIKCGFVSVGK